MRDVRRLLAKDRRLLHLWRAFMSEYDGHLFHGPFSKLIQVLAQIGWRVGQPPCILDDRGVPHCLVSVPLPLLRRLLEQSWLNHVARSHLHRSTMADLRSLDRPLAKLDHARMNALDLSRMAAIQSGAFLFSHHHAKFDLTQTGLCSLCQVPDDVQHRVCHCPKYRAARAPHQWAVDLWPVLPVCLTHHLLPLANPFLMDFAALLRCQSDCTAWFSSLEFRSGRQCLFSDGSCSWADVPELALASWGLIHANTGKVLGCGPVAGEHQTVPRAEMTAALAAMKWTVATKQAVTLWCDARAVVDGIQMLQGQVTSTDFAENEDLWQLLEEQLRQIPAEDFIIKHVPSHLLGSKCESPFEEWIAEHNQHADRVAVMANQNRPEVLAQAHTRAVRYHCHQAALIRAFRSILFSIAAEDTDHICDNPEPHESIPGPSALVWNTIALVDQMPIGWTLQAANFPADLPRSFVTAVWSMILQLDVQHDLKRRVSFIELVFLVKRLGKV